MPSMPATISTIRIELLNGVVRSYRAGEQAPSVSFTCNTCDTEVLAEIFECESGLALMITKWFSLGAGLTPDDPQWRKIQDKSVGTIILTMKAGDAQACFESTSTDSLRSRNIAHLENQQFKKTLMYESEDSIWYLDRREHPSRWLRLSHHLVGVSFLCLLNIWLVPNELQLILFVVLPLPLFWALLILWDKEDTEKARESNMRFTRHLLDGKDCVARLAEQKPPVLHGRAPANEGS